MSQSDQEHISRTLRQMEHIRMLSYEAETKAEERRLDREYGLLWKSIEPLIKARDAPLSDTQRPEVGR